MNSGPRGRAAKKGGGVEPGRTVRGRCPICAHYRKPGRSDGYCCNQTRDALPAYGINHPLHKLPADNGASCETFERIK